MTSKRVQREPFAESHTDGFQNKTCSIIQWRANSNRVTRWWLEVRYNVCLIEQPYTLYPVAAEWKQSEQKASTNPFLDPIWILSVNFPCRVGSSNTSWFKPQEPILKDMPEPLFFPKPSGSCCYHWWWVNLSSFLMEFFWRFGGSMDRTQNRQFSAVNWFHHDDPLPLKWGA